jgi:hypothetical protein
MASDDPVTMVLHQSELPLLRTVIHGPVNEADYATYFAEYDAYAHRDRRWIHVVDATRATAAPSSALRRRMAEDAKGWQHRGATPIAIAYVIRNPIVRGALTAIHWMSRPRYPTRVASNVPDALRFTVHHLDVAGVPRTPALEAYLVEQGIVERSA